MRFFNHRWHMSTALLLTASLVLSGCALPVLSSVKDGRSNMEAAAATKTVDGLKHEGTLTVGIRTSSTAPFVVGQASSADGLDIELAAAVADQIGLKVSYVQVDSVADSLASSCDVVMGADASDGEGLDIVGSYASSAFAFFTKGKSDVVSANDLAEKSIGLQTGSAAQEAFRSSGIAATAVEFATLNEAFDALESGKVDYVLCHAMSGAYLANMRGGLSFAGTLNSPSARGMAVSGGEVTNAVREAYTVLESNGVLAETCRRWLGDMPPLTADSQVSDLPAVDAAGNGAEEDSDVAAKVEEYEAEYAWVSQKDGTHAGQNAVTYIVDSGSSSSGYGSGYGYSNGYSSNYGW